MGRMFIGTLACIVGFGVNSSAQVKGAPAPAQCEIAETTFNTDGSLKNAREAYKLTLKKDGKYNRSLVVATKSIEGYSLFLNKDLNNFLTVSLYKGMFMSKDNSHVPVAQASGAGNLGDRRRGIRLVYFDQARIVDGKTISNFSIMVNCK